MIYILAMISTSYMYTFLQEKNVSGALNGKMLLVRIIENSKIYAYFRSESEMRKYPLNLFSIILEQAFYH